VDAWSKLDAQKYGVSSFGRAAKSVAQIRP
jgi:hypothetical protein